MTELEYLLYCLNQIDSHYLNVMGLNQANRTYQQAAENAFTAELYHKLKSEQHRYDEDSVWHFDLNKERANSIRPDLVLHQSPHNRNDQRIFVEVKTDPSTSNRQVISDLTKLHNAVKTDDGGSQLGFLFAFYILVQTDLKKIRQNRSIVEEGLRQKIQILNFKNETETFVKIELNEI